MNSKAEALNSAIRAALTSYNGSIVSINGIDIVGHTPSDKNFGSIEEWETITCQARCFSIIPCEEGGQLEEDSHLQLLADITYNRDAGFKVDITDIFTTRVVRLI